MKDIVVQAIADLTNRTRINNKKISHLNDLLNASLEYSQQRKVSQYLESKKNELNF